EKLVSSASLTTGKDSASLNAMRDIPGFDETLERGVNAIQSAMLDAKERSKLKQSEIATILGMPKGNVSRLEHSRAPSLDSFTRYLAACGYTFTVKLVRHRP
ncbi:MAG: helix-turn-helix domain-containing protein, partial [Bacteroidales bacterium]|nr:helix-turn-helix domain-containing protein [Bacteroidales bacterium]